jgi:hypothetical protein
MCCCLSDATARSYWRVDDNKPGDNDEIELHLSSSNLNHKVSFLLCGAFSCVPFALKLTAFVDLCFFQPGTFTIDDEEEPIEEEVEVTSLTFTDDDHNSFEGDKEYSVFFLGVSCSSSSYFHALLLLTNSSTYKPADGEERSSRA